MQPMAHTQSHTEPQIYIHGDSMTEYAQWGQFSENMAVTDTLVHYSSR